MMIDRQVFRRDGTVRSLGLALEPAFCQIGDPVTGVKIPASDYLDGIFVKENTFFGNLLFH